MRPTAYVLFLMGLVLAGSAALLILTPNPYTSSGDGMHGEPGRSPLFVITLFAAAAGAAGLAWAMLQFGGKGYTVTNSPLRR
jgi:hypothetical protein